jgi:hypothetical protein
VVAAAIIIVTIIKYIVGNKKVDVASYNYNYSYDRYASAVTFAILEY